MTAVERGMTALSDVRDLRLASIPAVIRIALGALWLVVAFAFPSPVTSALLLAVAVAAIVLWSGLSIASLWRASRAWLGWIAVALVAYALIALWQDDPLLVRNTVLFGVRLTLALAVALVISVPQDAEVLVDELIAWLRVPPRIAFEGLVIGRTVSGVPGDWHDHRVALRSRGLSAHGWIRRPLRALTSIGAVLSRSRARLHAMRTTIHLSGLAAAPATWTRYRPFSYGNRGAHAAAFGLAVAIAAVVAGLIVG